VPRCASTSLVPQIFTNYPSHQSSFH
jgi:hypothetical protein